LPASECCSAATPCTTAAAGGSSQAVTVEVPEIGSQEIAGEWLIPNDGILLVSFGPHTVADKDGNAVIRERLAIVEADEAAEPIGSAAPRPAMWGTPVPAYAVPIVPAPAAMAMPPMAVTPSPSAVPAPAAPMTPMPPMPSRSTPQGYHKDGKTAELPPLPPEEADDDDDDEESSDSAETRPSPQMKKPRHPGAMKTAKPKPSDDTAMKKAQFTISNFQAIPSLFQPAAPAVGLQFLLPIKPVSLKLPFNRRLEIEIYGRVVRAPEQPARSSADLATKGGPTTK
jgi:hypothetical protein